MKYKNEIIFFIGGALYALAFPFFETSYFMPGIIISSAIFLSQFFNSGLTLKKKLFNTLIYIWGYNCVGYYWLNFTLFEFGGLYPPFNILMWQLFTLIIAPHILLFTCISHYVQKRFSTTIIYPAILVFVYTTLEYYIPQQFPAHLGHPWQVLTPYLNLAGIFGVPFYSALTMLIAVGIILKKQKIRKSNLYLVLSLVLLTINFLAGKIESKTNEELNLRIVQANIGNDLKLKSEQGLQLAASQVVNTYKAMSLKDLPSDTDLVIWPETAYPRVLSTTHSPKAPWELQDTIERSGAKLFIGTYDLAHQRMDSYEQQYNTAIQFNADSTMDKVYHKRVLIPFGEGLPFGSLNRHIAPYVRNISFFAKGQNSTVFTLRSSKFISLICYEILFPEYLRSYLNSVDDEVSFMMNLTNDSWYGPYAEQEQHLFLAKWRSYEFGLPLVRATNTGISLGMNANGQEIARTKNFEQTTLDFKFNSVKYEPSLYLKYGFLNYTGLMIFIFGLIGITSKIPLLKDRAF
ncbi:apolipoprotein N-acyltransferase [Bacteriovorax sp. Seq25_V]|uniref:apolipoprotein N-acyltransferase n=1 Tax=Bacteriovorax sp. Seq25_V TaxID=1201288 RepID=UPI0005598F55|nr:apolipoprotein N-acyltransferase [Bacteriovorax sp. Seq25_V]